MVEDNGFLARKATGALLKGKLEELVCLVSHSGFLLGAGMKPPHPPPLNAHMHTDKTTAWIMCTVAVRDRKDGGMVENVQLEV